MSLVLYSNQDLDAMEKMATSFFSGIILKNIQKVSFANATAPFLPDQLCRLFKIKTIKKSRNLVLKFILPSYKKEFRSNHLDIISYLVGHEGKGSLLSYLSSKGFAMALISSKWNISDYFSMFLISIDLTEEGLENIPLIMEIIYSYLALLKQNEIPNYIVEEIQKIGKIQFEFRNKLRIMGKSLEVSKALNDYPPELINKINYLFEEFVPDKFRDVLDKLNPQNMIVELRSHDFDELPEEEPIYGTTYSVEKIKKDLLSRLNEILQDFGKNIFIYHNLFIYLKLIYNLWAFI